MHAPVTASTTLKRMAERNPELVSELLAVAGRWRPRVRKSMRIESCSALWLATDNEDRDDEPGTHP